MTQYVLSSLLSSLVMSAIILAAIAFNALFPKVFTAKLRYAVWLVVLIGLIIPFRPVIGGGVVAVPLPEMEQTQPVSSESALIPGTLPGTDATLDTGITESVVTDNVLSPVMICVLLWGIVAVLIFAYHIWRYLRFIRMIRRWGERVEDERVLSALKSAQMEIGLNDKNIDLRICGFVSSSMLTGFMRPVIILPDKSFDDDELALIFKHELIHYKHHDLFVKLLTVIAVSIHWFNPLVYLMSASVQADGEATCDEAVLRNADIKGRQFYAEVIIGMIGGKKHTVRTVLSTCFYGGKSSIKKRLDYIMDTTRKIKKPAAAVLVAAVALTILSGSVFALTLDTSDNETPLKKQQPVKLTAEQAKSVALATVGGGTVASCVNEFENNQEYYRIEVIYGTKKYNMDIDPINSTVLNYQVADFGQSAASSDTQSLTAVTEVPEPGKINEEQAREIALATVGGGTVTDFVNEVRDNRKVYKIEVIYGDKKYSMDIDTANSDIMNYQVEEIVQPASSVAPDKQASSSTSANNPAPANPSKANDTSSANDTAQSVSSSQNAQDSTQITHKSAQEIAFAGVGGGKIKESKLEYEDGRLVYEFKILYNGSEYEVEVDAAAGEIVKCKIDD